MKTWFASFAKFKISVALDERPPRAERSPLANSEELQRFARAIEAVDQQLQAAKPSLESPAALHDSIMKAVRAGHPAPYRPAARLRWIPASAVAIALAIAGAWWLSNRAPQPVARQESSLSAAATALQVGSEMPPALGSAAVAPLSSELDRCNQDLANVAQFLLASLP